MAAETLFTGEQFLQSCLRLKKSQAERRGLQGPFPLVVRQLLKDQFQLDIDHPSRKLRAEELEDFGSLILESYERGHKTSAIDEQLRSSHLHSAKLLVDSKALLKATYLPGDSGVSPIHETVLGQTGGRAEEFEGPTTTYAEGYLSPLYPLCLSQTPDWLELQQPAGGFLLRRRSRSYNLHVTNDNIDQLELEIAWPNELTITDQSSAPDARSDV